jgi:hypothetical protein
VISFPVGWQRAICYSCAAKELLRFLRRTTATETDLWSLHKRCGFLNQPIVEVFLNQRILEQNVNIFLMETLDIIST